MQERIWQFSITGRNKGNHVLSKIIEMQELVKRVYVTDAVRPKRDELCRLQALTAACRLGRAEWVQYETPDIDDVRHCCRHALAPSAVAVL